ncbi:CGNR zinc finger domain-containing protein [Bacillus sp. NP157]|nr:CGNR zinc finger domain-containing protein [Bacillus sp. NP157]
MNPVTSLEMPPILADQPALDLINTVVMENGESVDHLVSDAATAAWLSRMTGGPVEASAGLGARAVELREVIRQAVLARKRGVAVDVGHLNALTRQMSSHLELVAHGDSLRTERRYEGDASWRALAPLGEAALTLLAEGDFSLVRECEHDDCSLWFYDRTKSHRRRWCSMAMCGNRHKVSQFRKRRET